MATYGLYYLQGRRPTMEDAHTVVPSLRDMSEGAPFDHPPLEGEVDLNLTFFGVFDGHGGVHASEYSAANAHSNILAAIESQASKPDLSAAIRDGLLATDEAFCKDAVANSFYDGTTAVVALIDGAELHMGNIGDSEALLGRWSGGFKVMTTIHNTKKNPGEQERVTALGGKIVDQRVCHPTFPPETISTAVSRAIGNVILKKGDYTRGLDTGLVADPDLHSATLTPDDGFLIMACDGLWDVCPHGDAVNFVRDRLVRGDSVGAVTQALVDWACELGTTDNVSALIVRFDERADLEEPAEAGGGDGASAPSSAGGAATATNGVSATAGRSSRSPSLSAHRHAASNGGGSGSSDLHATAAEVARLEAIVSDLRATVRTRDNRISLLESEFAEERRAARADLRAAQREVEELQDEVAAGEREVSRQTSRVATQERELDELRDRLRDLRSAESDGRRAAARLDEAEGVARDLRSKISRLERDVEEADRTRVAETSRLREQLEAARKEAREAAATTTALRSDLSAAARETERLKRENEAATGEVDGLRGDVAAADRRASDLQTRLAAALAEGSDAGAGVAELERELAEERARRGALEGELDDLRRRNKELAREVSDLGARLDVATRDATSATEDASSARDRYETERDRASELEAKASALRDRVATAEAGHDALERRCASLEQETARLREELETAQSAAAAAAAAAESSPAPKAATRPSPAITFGAETTGGEEGATAAELSTSATRLMRHATLPRNYRRRTRTGDSVRDGEAGSGGGDTAAAAAGGGDGEAGSGSTEAAEDDTVKCSYCQRALNAPSAIRTDANGDKWCLLHWESIGKNLGAPISAGSRRETAPVGVGSGETPTFKARSKRDYGRLRSGRSKSGSRTGRSGSGSRFGGTADKCEVCEKRVYQMEKLEVEGHGVFHRACFRCSKCQQSLKPDGFDEHDGTLYCARHYKRYVTDASA